jgi:S1-C subfamily serine protease
MKSNWIKAFKDGFVISATVIIALNISFLVYKVLFQTTVKPTNNQEYASTSVMITRYDGRTGGTGVIISSKRNQSQVLTNAHVCSLLKNGGIIRSDSTKGVVKSYQVSNIHDLCLITTNTNFHINTVISDNQPEVYDDAIVSGHPHLLPNIVTHGHFSQKEIVNILTGFRRCRINDLFGDNAEYCQHLGVIPIIKSLEAQIVSATIMPGSSGSAVFNAKGELSGLVFAGSGAFGYGMIVPQEYLVSFFETELPMLESIYPNNGNTKPKNEINWKSACLKPATRKIQRACELVSRSLLLTK